MKKSSFLFGVILLTLVNFFVRSLGFIYRIFLSRIIGAEAIGLYQMVFPFLMVLITIPTAGIPIAVSKLTAKESRLQNRAAVYKILALSLLMGGVAALALSVLVSVYIDFIVRNILKNTALYYPLLWAIPAITLITFSSIIRGFFYGLKDMMPPAGAQIIEQITRIVFVLSYLYYISASNPVKSAVTAIIGLSIGEFFGLLYLMLHFNYKNLDSKKIYFKIKRKSSLKLLNNILYISVPITLSRLLSVLMQSINAILIPQRLIAAGYSSVDAVETFGKISGMAMPLLFLPFTVTSALVLNIIPNVSELLAADNQIEMENKSNLALRITLLIAIPTTVAFIFFGSHISGLIYNHSEVGIYLSIISYSTVFLCMQHTLSGILHGMGKQVITTVNIFLGSVIQLYCTYYLIPNPKYGINGFFIGFTFSSFIIFFLHLITLNKLIKLRLPLIQTVLKPLGCSILMIGLMFCSYKFFYSLSGSNVWSTFFSSITGICSYFISLAVSKTFNFYSLIHAVKK